MSMRFGNSVAIQWLELYTFSLLRARVQFLVRELESPPFLLFGGGAVNIPLPHTKMHIPFNPLIPLPEIFSKEIISSWQK